MEMQACREWVSKALSYEKAARWSEAQAARREAHRIVTCLNAATCSVGQVGGYERRERARARQNGLTVGTVLQHVRRGKVLAICVYEAERRFIYAGKAYMSISAAAVAAGADIGVATKNGWQFWGLEQDKRRGWGGRRI